MTEKGIAFLLKAPATGATVTFTNATNICNYTGHGMSAGDPVIFNTVSGTLPAALTANQVYFAGTILANSFTMHLTKAAALAGSGAVALADDGSGTLTAQIMQNVGGMRTNNSSLNGEEVNITDKDSSNWRTLLAGAGEVSMSLGAAGVYKDDDIFNAMRAKVITRVLDTYMLIFESGDTYWGLYQVMSTEQAGEHNGAVTYTLTLESGGPITFIENV